MTLRPAAALLLGLLAAGPAVAGGFAQEVVVPAPAAPTAVPPSTALDGDWSGFYLGGQLGRGRLDFDDGTSGDVGLEGEGPSGTLLGVHAGYMFDFGRVVLGGELDYDRADLTLTEEGDDFAEVDSVARAKVRLGFDAGRVLPYVTAGAARLGLSSDDPDWDGTADATFLGLGAAVSLGDRLTIGAEILRHDVDPLGGEAFEEFDPQLDTITLRGSFSF